MKARRVIKILISILYIISLMILGYSPPMGREAAPLPILSTPTPEPTPTPTPVPTVAFAAGSFPVDAEGLSLLIQAEELPLLDQFPGLKSLDLSGSDCYEEILAWAAEHKDVALRYTVRFADGVEADNSATSLDLSGLSREEAQAAPGLLKYLPELTEIQLGQVGDEAPFTGAEVGAILEQLPEVKLGYRFSLMGKEVDPMAESIDLSTMSHEQVTGTAALLSAMPKLKNVVLGSDDGRLTWDDLAQIRDACPNAVLDYACKYWDQDINLNAEVLNFSHVYMGDEGESIRNLLPFTRNLKALDMDTTGISNAAMKALRDEYPNVNIVWRVNFGDKYSVRTDVIKILASKPSKAGPLTDKDVEALSCCTKVKYIDIGHNENLHDFSFFNSMPDLEVAILTMTGVSDISSLANCPHLEYLEITHTKVSDLSPLANATELRHLNIGDSKVTDIQALYGLTELERLWICARHHVPKDQIEYMQQCAPNCVINVDADDPSLGAWRFSDLNDDGWAVWRETGYFKFENHPRYELLREQFGYDTEDYSFYWLDPLY